MQSKFVSFTQAYIDLIDNGSIFKKPYQWLYAIIAIVSGLVPVGILVAAISNRLFDMPFKIVVAFLLILAIIAIAAVINALLWWSRMRKLELMVYLGDEFIATPLYANFIQTTGESAAAWIAIAGTGASIVAAIFLSSNSYAMYSLLPVPVAGLGFVSMLACPVIAFSTLIFSRFIAELIGALATIANNTQK